jgi:hypothetical protein
VATSNSPRKKKKIGRIGMSPNLYPDRPQPDPEIESRKAESRANMANVPGESKSGDKPPTPKKKITAEDTPDTVNSSKPRSRNSKDDKDSKATKSKDSKSKDVKSKTNKTKDDDSNDDDSTDSGPSVVDKPRKGVSSWFGWSWSRSDKPAPTGNREPSDN